jgi:hypothetical protein
MSGSENQSESRANETTMMSSKNANEFETGAQLIRDGFQLIVSAISSPSCGQVSVVKISLLIVDIFSRLMLILGCQQFKQAAIPSIIENSITEFSRATKGMATPRRTGRNQSSPREPRRTIEASVRATSRDGRQKPDEKQGRGQSGQPNAQSVRDPMREASHLNSPIVNYGVIAMAVMAMIALTIEIYERFIGPFGLGRFIKNVFVSAFQ